MQSKIILQDGSLVAAVPNNYTGSVSELGGNILHYLNGKLHKRGCPALEWYDGSLEYFFKGKAHRTDGFAAIWNSGNVETLLLNRVINNSSFILLVF